MNVNGLNSQYIIDSKSAQSVTDSLFTALQNKSVDYSKTNLQGFTRQTLGVDLYNQKTDLNIQRQIAISNSGAFDSQMNLSSVQSLNSFAAQQLYSSSVTSAVGGKMTIDAIQPEIKGISTLQDIQSSINVYETNKDKKGSNPFSFDNFLGNSQTQEENQA